MRVRVSKRRDALASVCVDARRLGLRLRGSALAHVLFRAVARTLAGCGQCSAIPSLFFPHLARIATRSCLLLLHPLCNSTRLTNSLPWPQAQTTKRNVFYPFLCSNKTQKRHWLWPGSAIPDMGTLVRQARRPQAATQPHSPALTPWLHRRQMRTVSEESLFTQSCTKLPGL